jgi:uncharacterized protein (AIM24 family)
MIHAGGTIVKRSLRSGETLRVDTGCLVAMNPSVQYDIQMQKGIKNMFFGKERLAPRLPSRSFASLRG